LTGSRHYGVWEHDRVMVKFVSHSEAEALLKVCGPTARVVDLRKAETPGGRPTEGSASNDRASCP
jgi:hypothetical protein